MWCLFTVSRGQFHRTCAGGWSVCVGAHSPVPVGLISLRWVSDHSDQFLGGRQLRPAFYQGVVAHPSQDCLHPDNVASLSLPVVSQGLSFSEKTLLLCGFFLAPFLCRPVCLVLAWDAEVSWDALQDDSAVLEETLSAILHVSAWIHRCLL